MKCPHCKQHLERLKLNKDFYYLRCRKGDGRLLPTLAVERFKNADRLLPLILNGSAIQAVANPFSCPICRKNMVRTRVGPSDLVLDRCDYCKHIWFEEGETEKLKHYSDLGLPFERKDGDPVEMKAEEGFSPRVSLPLFIQDDRAMMRFPGFTVLLVLGITAFSHLRFKNPWLYYPDTPLMNNGKNLIFSILNHADFPHLMSNMVVLFLFAVRLEDRKGIGALFNSFFISGVIAKLVYSAFGGVSPSLGASAAVAGVAACFLAVSPFARVEFLIQRIWYHDMDHLVISYSAKAFFALYLLIETFSHLFFAGTSQVNHLGHLTGAIVGYMYGRTLRNAED